MKIPSFDVTRQNMQIGNELHAAMARVVQSGHFILGENVAALEQEIASYCMTEFGVGVANGSDALHLALMALDVGPGDEVIVPAFTFFATAGAVMRTGATPVFADIDPITFNLDPDAFEQAITIRTRAVIPVHLYGQMADMDRIMDIARARGVKVIEDCAQAIGAEYRGRRAGSIGDIGSLSFFPTKNLGAFGDAGMLVTHDEALANRIAALRAHGARQKYYHEELGYNSRLDEIQAAVLRVKLRYLDEWTERRRAIAAAYAQRLAGGAYQVPTEAPGTRHVYHQFTLLTENRHQVQERCAALGVATTVYYPQPLHQQKVFMNLPSAGKRLPNAERASAMCLSLPMFPELTQTEIECVVGALTEV